jgi:hypothetical protein
MTATTAWRRPAVLYVAAALVVGFAARLLVGLSMNVAADGVHRGFDFYGFMADHVLDGRGLYWDFYDDLGAKWANRGPLYPLVVAASRFAFGRGSPAPVVAVQAAVGALGCLVPAALAARWGGTRAAVIAAWTAALWPYWVVLDTGLVEHVVYAPLVGLAVLLSLRAADADGPLFGAVAGVVAGLATLARLTFGATAALLCVVLALRTPRVARAALFVAGVVVALAPWIVRNRAVTGEWTLGTDGGRAMWIARSAEAYALHPEASIDDAERAVFKRLTPDEWRAMRDRNDDESAQDALFFGRAVASIEADPGRAAWGGLRNAAALWSPIVNPLTNRVGAERASAAKVVVFAVSALLLLGGVVAAALGVPRIRADLPTCAAAAASFTLVAALFWAESRYLAPLHGMGIAALGAWIAEVVAARGDGTDATA